MRLDPKGPVERSERADLLARMVKECVGALGLSCRPVSSLYTGPMAKAYQGVVFTEQDAHLTQNEMSDRVLECVSKAVVTFQRDLARRGADASIGYSSTACTDLSQQVGWDASMPRYAVWLKWYGPMPTFWPHPIDASHFAKPKDSDLPTDAEFKQKYGEAPEKMMKRSQEAQRKEAKRRAKAK